MAVFEPLALLAAVLAIVAAQSWWAVATVANRHGGDASRVSRKLYLASVATTLALATAAASILVLPLVALAR